MTRYTFIFITLFIFVVLLGSCSVVRFAKIYSKTGSSGSDGRLKGQVYSSDDTRYRIGRLSGQWQVIDSGSGDIFFWNNEAMATITIDSVCDKNKLKYNLKALSDSLVVGIKDKEMVKRDDIMVDGSEALYTQYEGIYESERIGIATIVVKKQECIYDFSYSALAPKFNKYLEDYLSFASDFRVIDQ